MFSRLSVGQYYYANSRAKNNILLIIRFLIKLAPSILFKFGQFVYGHGQKNYYLKLLESDNESFCNLAS